MKRALLVLVAFLAFGGTTFAAGHYVITSTHQIKPSVLKHLRGRTGPSGAKGAPGPQGLQGPAGVAGSASLSQSRVVHGPEEAINGVAGIARAQCPEGEAVISGGGASTGPALKASYPFDNASGWYVETGPGSGTLYAVAICAKVGKGFSPAVLPVFLTAKSRPSG
jgi:hypothetical protein